ncbi:hypothetical protein ACLK2G_17410 [Escherichia coli]
MKPGKGAQLARSAGTFIQILAREGNDVTLRLRSGEVRKVVPSAALPSVKWELRAHAASTG